MDYRKTVEEAGGRFVGVVGDSVLFTDPVSGRSLSLYIKALRSVADVELALKSAREKNLEFEPWGAR
jgi:hypothetical protein